MNVLKVDPYAPEAIALIDELSSTLAEITGNSGRGSFNLDDVCIPRALLS